jgi:hypothetical protein
MSLSLGVRGVLLGIAAAVLAQLLGSTAAAWATNCPNEVSRTGLSAALPDCRAYEMVSPPNKNGGEVDGGVSAFGEWGAPQQAASDGEAVTYGSTSSFLESEAASAIVTSQYVSTRTPSGWHTQEVTPKQQTPEDKPNLGVSSVDFSEFQGFSEDLARSFLLAWAPEPEPAAPEGFYSPYVRDDESGAYELLSLETPQAWQPFERVNLGSAETGQGFGSGYAGMSANGQHVIFAANEALTPEAVPGRDNLYQWNEGQPLELVSVLPNHEVYAKGQEHPQEVGSLFFGTGPQSHSGALSSNGMRAFWGGGGRIYMHEITASGARTVEVSASQKGAGGAGTGKYWTANPSGSRVYFTSGEQLTDASVASAGEDLYEYDVETGVLSDLTVDRVPGQSAQVQGVLGSGESEGVSYVYFVARGVLEEDATAGANNLYVLRVGSGEPKFIATLGSGVQAEEVDYTSEVTKRPVRVSPSGLLLAFQSERPLTGYDNIPAGAACPAPERDGESALRNSEGRCMEVFEYDTQTGKLACASCNAGGLPPTGESIAPYSPHLFANIYGWQTSTVQQRYLLNDGRLFFDSEDALLPQVTDGKQNVYEYEPEGVGACAVSGGGSCLYLISSGTSSEASAFVDAGESGRDVFFVTRQQLVAQDDDEAIDLYDAREDGGFAEAQLPPCSGEACKPAVTAAPAIYGAPPSATFQGAGNVPTPPVKSATKKKTAKKKVKKKAKRKASSKRTVKAKKSAERPGRGGR